MSGEWFDWQGALSEDAAHAYAHGAETALGEATEAASGDAQALALVGIGYALLSLRSTLARSGEDAADQLSSMADDVRDLTATIAATPAAGGRWWRIAAALTPCRRRRVEGEASEGEASEEGQAPADRPALCVVTQSGGDR